MPLLPDVVQSAIQEFIGNYTTVDNPLSYKKLSRQPGLDPAGEDASPRLPK